MLRRNNINATARTLIVDDKVVVLAIYMAEPRAVFLKEDQDNCNNDEQYRNNDDWGT